MLTWGKVSANERHRFFAVRLNGKRIATARADRDCGPYTTRGFQLGDGRPRQGGPRVWKRNARQTRDAIRSELEGMGVAA